MRPYSVVYYYNFGGL